MPLTIILAHKLNARMAELRRSGVLPWLRPDSKTQVGHVLCPRASGTRPPQGLLLPAMLQLKIDHQVHGELLTPQKKYLFQKSWAVNANILL